MRVKATFVLVVLMLASAVPLQAQSEESSTVTLEMLMSEIRELKESQQGQRHTYDRLMKAVADLMWHVKISDLAEVDKVRFTGPPRRYQPNPTAQGAGNPLIIRGNINIG